MTFLFGLALTFSLVWGISKEANAEPSCDNARCHSVGNVCLPGHQISFRESCTDPEWGGLRCELDLPCDFLFPEIE